MNPHLRTAISSAVVQHLSGVGCSGSLVPGGTGEPVQLQHVGVSRLSATRVQMQYGQDDQQYADAELLRAELGAVRPAKGDRLVIDDGDDAGVWPLLGIDRENAVVVVVRLRRSSRANAAAPGTKDLA